MKSTRSVAQLTGVVVLLLALPQVEASVRVWEEAVVLPTYVVDPPDPMPRFYEEDEHQGVQRRLYPYPVNDALTRRREERTYRMVYLENEYIQVSVIPEIGGRLFSALDKTNGYDFFYRQHVIKPSLIGMNGAWISGGIEWGFPHHHGPDVHAPMDWTYTENGDGSATVWIANVDRLHRMRVLVGYTLRPESSLLEMSIRPQNRSPLVHSMLVWTNPAVHVDTTYQVIFPPSVEYVTGHSKREMNTWPVASGRWGFGGVDGLDISWWKNITSPSSFFAWNPQEDLFGGYDHGADAGVVWVGDRHIAPGMKFWAWGNGPAGEMADRELTDTDGPYIELMAGAYSDNQPDYSWLQPHESKSVTMTWFPIRNLGGLSYATLEVALKWRSSTSRACA